VAITSRDGRITDWKFALLRARNDGQFFTGAHRWVSACGESVPLQNPFQYTASPRASMAEVE